MANGQLLSYIIRQAGVNLEKLCYLCGIPVDEFWKKLSGARRFSPRQIDRLCTVLRITPDLRREIFGEEEGDG